MNLLGLMLVRNESWILGASLRAALQWCDSVVLLDHASVDRTPSIVKECDPSGSRIHYDRWEDAEKWDEMELRQRTLEMGRAAGGTHFAIIDADEIPTGNVLFRLRDWVAGLNTGDLLELPMLAMRTLNEYQDDDSVWSRAWLTLAFKDAPHLSWKPASDGYQHHNRPPYGAAGTRVRPIQRGDGGILHAQFMNTVRLKMKHLWYAVMERSRWPGRMSAADINRKYGEALLPPKHLSSIPPDWLLPDVSSQIDLTETKTWHIGAIRRIIQIHGASVLNGLDLRGLESWVCPRTG